MIQKFLGAFIAALASALVLSGPVAATPAKEAPWLPEAAAYRLTLFLGNLEPLPWDDIETAWTEPYRGSEFSVGALAWLDRKSDIEPDGLLDAIMREDLQAVFAEATRLVALRIEENLDRALAAEESATAQLAVQTARELYRAFEDGIAAADPEAARRIGLAWLELNSSTGSVGVLGAGATSADRDTMEAARAVISGYLAENYLLDSFAPRRTLSALPETAVLSGKVIEVPPSLPPGSDIFDQDPLPLLVLNFEEQGIDETDLPLVAVDGAFFNPIFNDRRDDPLDIPSLRGLRFTGPYGRDGRFASLRDFTRNVVVNEFGGKEPTPFMLDALVAYMLEFDFLPNSMLTTDGRLTDTTQEAARRGEEIFNTPFARLGDRSCASCHVPDANFLDRQAHDIGSVAPGYEGARAGALDTPTLLGTAYTAPYFHDGSLPTLAAVVDWFDETKSLGLTEEDRADLTAYLETVGAADEPYEAFDTENTAFRLAFAELTTFASTIDTLLPRRDAEHILLLTDTVAADLSADASTMSNLPARPEVYALAERLAAVGAAVRVEDWEAAEASWTAFKSEADAIEERAF